MTKSSILVAKRRMETIEAAIERFGWTMTLERRLAEQLGVHRRTVRMYKQRIAEDMRVRIPMGDRETERAVFLASLRGHRQRAEAAGAHGPVAGMLSLEGRILGLDETTLRMASPDGLRVEFGAPLPPSGPADPAPSSPSPSDSPLPSTPTLSACEPGDEEG